MKPSTLSLPGTLFAKSQSSIAISPNVMVASQTALPAQMLSGHSVDPLEDLDLVLQANFPGSFYGGKGAPFEKLRQLGSIIKISVQLRQKNGDLLQLMPGDAPTFEAILTVCDNKDVDLTHTNTLNLGASTSS